jgi:choline dehydrogenase-like flavoprotein
MVADYVIVGAGSAGCVLAARLSEDPDVKVLLLEAGGPDSVAELHIPAAFPAVFKSGLDWDLFGEQEPGLGGRRLYLPRGRVIGGSGSFQQIYLRGHRAADAVGSGNRGWRHDVSPVLRHSGTMSGIRVQTRAFERGWTALATAAIESCSGGGQAGRASDQTGPASRGVSGSEAPRRGDRRRHLNPALDRDLRSFSGVRDREGDRAVASSSFATGTSKRCAPSAGDPLAGYRPLFLMLSGISRRLARSA